MVAPETTDAPELPRLRLGAAAKIGVRVIISAVLLVLLIIKIPSDSIQPKDTHAGTLTFLAVGIAVTLAGFVLSAWRWQRVFAVFDTHVPLRTLLAFYLAGQFVGNVLPSTIGGDVLRVSRAAKATGTSDVAFASVVIERLTGFVALPVLTVLGFVLEPSLREASDAWIAIAIAAATVGGFLVILVVAGSAQLAGRFARHQNWMRFIGAIHVGVDRIRREPRRGVSVLVAALAYQVSVVVSVWCAVHTLGISLPNAAVLAFVPAVACAQVLPISLSGLGIREGLLALLLHPLGVPTGKAIGVGLLWYGMTLVVSLLGAPAFAVGHRHDNQQDESSANPPTAAAAHAP